MSAPERANPKETADAARAHLEAEVDAALAVYAGTLSAADLAWIRERLVEGAADDEAISRLVRAALPRDVDESGEVFFGGTPTLGSSAAPRHPKKSR